MTGFKPGTQDIVEGGVGAQTRQALENIRATLRPAGGEMSDVGECTVFLLDMADYAAMNSAYTGFCHADPPARVNSGSFSVSEAGGTRGDQVQRSDPATLMTAPST